MNTPTKEQIAAAKACLADCDEPHHRDIMRDYMHANNLPLAYAIARILLAALEAAEADGARLDWVNRQSDIVYYDGTHGTVWNIGVEGEDRTLCVRTAIDQAMKKDAARKEDRT